jgi:Arc/MetJ-type ribon-helix-helix transcriptional regulator
MRMIPEFKGKIAFRLKIEEREIIEELIATGKYKNISAFVRAAVEEKLRNT